MCAGLLVSEVEVEEWAAAAMTTQAEAHAAEFQNSQNQITEKSVSSDLGGVGQHHECPSGIDA